MNEQDILKAVREFEDTLAKGGAAAAGEQGSQLLAKSLDLSNNLIDFFKGGKRKAAPQKADAGDEDEDEEGEEGDDFGMDRYPFKKGGAPAAAPDIAKGVEGKDVVDVTGFLQGLADLVFKGMSEINARQDALAKAVFSDLGEIRTAHQATAATNIAIVKAMQQSLSDLSTLRKAMDAMPMSRVQGLPGGLDGLRKAALGGEQSRPEIPKDVWMTKIQKGEATEAEYRLYKAGGPAPAALSK